jgi:mono/diheme cytochrome c family protein
MNRPTPTHNARALAFLVFAAAALGVKPAVAQDRDAEKLARGKYLVTVAGCNDCHTPWKMGPAGPEPDMTRMLSGHPQDFRITAPATFAADQPWIGASSPTNTAHSGPWGVSFTANLTPDPETGLGKWTQATFTQTIRTGRHLGRGRKILPPMPIPMYKNFTDEDLAAIFTYLQSIPAIKNQVPEPLPPAGAAASGGG